MLPSEPASASILKREKLQTVSAAARGHAAITMRVAAGEAQAKAEVPALSEENELTFNWSQVSLSGEP